MRKTAIALLFAALGSVPVFAQNVNYKVNASTDVDADGFLAGNPNGCTLAWYSSDGHTHTRTTYTAADCAIETAYLNAHSAASNKAVIFRSQSYPTCGAYLDTDATANTSKVYPLDLDVDGLYAVDLYGASRGGTSLTLTPISGNPACTGSVVFGHLDLPQTGKVGLHKLMIRDLTFNMNNLPSGLYLGGLLRPVISHVNVDNSTITGDVVQLGKHYTTGVNGIIIEGHFEALNVRGADAVRGSGAIARASLSGGVPAITVTAGGSGYNASSPPNVWLSGYGASGNSASPCTTMGTTAATVSGGSVTGITTTASGCSGTVAVNIVDGPPAQNGLDIQWVTDSNFYGTVIRGYGRNCAVRVAPTSGADFFYGIHAYSNQRYQFCDYGKNHYYGIEIDGAGQYGFGEWGTNTTVSGVLAEWPTAVAKNSNVAEFYIDSSASRFSVSGLGCAANAYASGYNEIVTSKGPFGDGLPGAFSSNVSFTQNNGCSLTANNDIVGTAVSYSRYINVSQSITAANYKTQSNCASNASPAACSSYTAGAVTVAAGATTKVVNTTAVTANSQIFLTFDSSLGSRLGVTCNANPVPPAVSARTTGARFTITLPSAPAANPACFSFFIVN